VNGVHIITHTTQDITEDPKRPTPAYTQPRDDMNSFGAYDEADTDDNGKSRWMDQYPDPLLEGQPKSTV
jgi:hypothetical protein